MNSLGLSRRSFLQIGSLSLGGLALGDLGRMRAYAGTARRRDTCVILLWLEGGASQLETYDLKPNAPVEVRGEFRPIRTRVPGIDVCELLPRHAPLADRFSLIRSLTHRIPEHAGAATLFLTGYNPDNINDPIAHHPTIEAVTAHERAGRNSAVPAHVSSVNRLKGGGSAYLGSSCDPFVMDADPNAADFRVDCLSLDAKLAARLDDRRTLLTALDRWQQRVETSRALQAQDQFRRRAFALLSSSGMKRALDLSRESDKVRDRYGRHEWGQRLLMARRLAEAGCSFVTVPMMSVKARVDALYSWDDHGDNGNIFKYMHVRLPMFDQCVSALIEDLAARSLDRQVLLVVAGEFGRTPVLNMGRAAKPMNPGRDHWPHAMSVLVSGGGWSMGRVVGETDSRAAAPREKPLHPNDLLASIYQFLGIDPTRTLHDTQGRPNPILPHGKPISELVG